MKSVLSRRERETVRHLLAWDALQRTRELILCNLALVLAGVILVGSAILTLFRLDDHTILGVLVPGFVFGSLLVGLYAFGLRRIQERRELACIIRKLEREA